jgi:hypothetical protein
MFLYSPHDSTRRESGRSHGRAPSTEHAYVQTIVINSVSDRFLCSNCSIYFDSTSSERRSAPHLGPLRVADLLLSSSAFRDRNKVPS